jgi:hypothetical protein
VSETVKDPTLVDMEQATLQIDAHPFAQNSANLL